jgi:hypothetical protein
VPFVIGIYYGPKTKPGNSNEFLKMFVDECLILQSEGITANDKVYSFRISCIVADAPARSFVKCIVSHNSLHGCEKCVQEGVYFGRATWPYSKNLELRNDSSFQNLDYEDHQHSKSRLSDLEIGLVSQVPLEYMHLICLGVMKRLIRIWVEKGPRHCRLGSVSRDELSNRLVTLAKVMPREFSRKPRSLKDFKFWKATEFRSFLLYYGPHVLKDILSKELYEHFLVFHCAMYILCSHLSREKKWVAYANELLHLFVGNVPKLYSKEVLNYSIHNLLHVCEDVNNFGCLDNYSAFPFENFMSRLKRLVRGPNRPLQQISKRIQEMSDSGGIPCVVKSRGSDGSAVRTISPSQLNGCCLSTFFPDSSFLTEDRRIGIVKAIESNNSGVYVLECDIFQTKEDFFQLPLRSSMIGIFLVKNRVPGCKVLSNQILTKSVLLPAQGDGQFVCIPYCNTERLS